MLRLMILRSSPLLAALPQFFLIGLHFRLIIILLEPLQYPRLGSFILLLHPVLKLIHTCGGRYLHIIPPYGTPPPPYVTMYTHGVYAHPSIPLGSHPYSPYTVPSSNGMAEASVPGANGKQGEQKSKIPVRRSKGSSANLDMLAGKDNETGKASGASANGGLSHSCSGNDGSCEGSDVNSQDGSQHKPLGEQSSVEAGTLNGSSACSVSSRTMWTPPAQAMLNQGMVMAVPPISVSGPTTNLNIGMDYWGGSAHSSSATTRTKLPVIPASAALLSSSEMDERELKRQRRKQSNRESARRSRLRKQAECEELAQRVETLKEENSSFRKELEHLREECEKLASENASLTSTFGESHRSLQEWSMAKCLLNLFSATTPDVLFCDFRINYGCTSIGNPCHLHSYKMLMIILFQFWPTAFFLSRLALSMEYSITEKKMLTVFISRVPLVSKLIQLDLHLNYSCRNWFQSNRPKHLRLNP
ncbi:PREDICTED: bZIP transcription factor 68-like isoform X2 [Nelumbo nucifera]|uniref:BZIP transcription factor 68-like isoform X2 n=1 Tax=Nelumbo nucifera TaxID=4432 RepID=A0A1U8Q0H7_NELNU|nr:PREDICTED: bZIP transcription factor 68-like isoform X2 [Nelumbo nucifera]XP_019052314.1 PREDICTED: bZIP transcription factor 68-like isoform X2 [Nelumbo nucifera]